jgi:Flp pilus assembly protein TadG
VELALAMPVVLLLVLAIVQLAVVVADALQVQLAAREGARAASVAGAPAGAGSAAAGRVMGRGGLVSVSVGGRVVTVTVTTINHTDVPLIGALLPDVTLSATVTMAVEPP